MHRSYRYRFYPTPEQEDLLRRTIGCVRWVYNRSLNDRIEAWAKHKKSLDYESLCANLTQIKKRPEFDFLNEVSSVALQQGVRWLWRGFVAYFEGRSNYPGPMRKRSGGAATFVGDGFRFSKEGLFLAKMDSPLLVVWSRRTPFATSPTTVTVTLDPAGRWHVRLLFEINPMPMPPVDEVVGLDMGITHLVTTDSGERVKNPRFKEKESARLALLSRRMSRKIQGSNNREKARIKLTRVYAAVKNRRMDHHHKLTTRLVRENQVIAVEDLNIRPMLRHPKLGRVVADAGWGMLLRMLDYKSKAAGRTFVKVDRFYPSSKTCSACGHVLHALPLKVREWTCPQCNVQHDRDINAARNILAAGLAATACGPDVRRRDLLVSVQLGAKQEVKSAKPSRSSGKTSANSASTIRRNVS